MRKLWFNLFIMAVLLLTACSQAQPEVADGPTAAPTRTSAPAVATLDPNAETMACEVVSLSPTPGPTEQSMFPPVTEDDWVLGEAQDPILTITEYSDFQ